MYAERSARTLFNQYVENGSKSNQTSPVDDVLQPGAGADLRVATVRFVAVVKGGPRNTQIICSGPTFR